MIEETAEFAASAGVFQLAQRLRLDLPYSLPGHRELLADFLKRMVRVHTDAEAHAQHPLFTRRQTGQHPRRGFAKIGVDRRVGG